MRRTTEDEIRGTGRSWNEVMGIAGDRKDWKQGVTGLDDDDDDDDDDNNNILGDDKHLVYF
jgi:hypothetical protein